jgi:hypothetical protein
MDRKRKALAQTLHHPQEGQSIRTDRSPKNKTTHTYLHVDHSGTQPEYQHKIIHEKMNLYNGQKNKRKQRHYSEHHYDISEINMNYNTS